jgi:SAM-dependent methyltransferase
MDQENAMVPTKPYLQRCVVGPLELAMTPDDAEWIRVILEGRYGHQPRAIDRQIRRVLDLGAGCGEFAIWAQSRWPRCWVDAVELDPVKQDAFAENRPLGTALMSLDAILAATPEDPFRDYQVIRIANVRILFVVAERVRAWKTANPKGTILIVDVLAWGGGGQA